MLTSQRVVDVILRAFEACAASQGCMNNITFGDETLGYYETVAGGAGAVREIECVCVCVCVCLCKREDVCVCCVYVCVSFVYVCLLCAYVCVHVYTLHSLFVKSSFHHL